MKVIVNVCFGGASLKDESSKKYGISKYAFDREDATLIDAMERGEDVSGDYAELVVATIPDNTTDWYLSDYDGYETLLYVVDGKIIEWEEEN